MRLHVALLAGAGCLMVCSGAGALLQPAPRRIAVVVASGPSALPAAPIAQRLRSAFGYGATDVVELRGLAATDKALADALEQLRGEVHEGSDVLVFLALRALEDERGTRFQAVQSQLAEPWTWPTINELLAWITGLPLRSALVVYPSCMSELQLRRLFGALEATGRSSFELLTYCHPAPKDSVTADEPADDAARAEFTKAFAGVLDELAQKWPHTFTSEEIAAQLQDRCPDLRVTLARSQATQRYNFALVPIRSSGFRERFASSTTAAAREDVVRSAIVAGQKGDDAAPAAEFLAEVVQDPGVDRSLRMQALRGLKDLPWAAARKAFVSTAKNTKVDAAFREEAVASVLAATDAVTLRELLDDSDPRVRTAAIHAAGVLRDPAAADRLAAIAQNDASPELRIAAIQSLSSIGRDEDRHRLIALLSDAAARVRQEAAAGLGRTGLGERPEADIALIQMLRGDTDSAVRRAAALALARAPSDIARRSAIESVLITMLGTGEDSVDQAVAFALGEIGTAPAATALLRALQSRAAQPPMAYIEALGKLRSAASVETLKKASGDGSEAVRGAATTALGEIGGAATIDVLFDRLDDESPFVRDAAIRALSQVGEVPPAVLHARLQSPSARQRATACTILARDPVPESFAPLAARLSDSDETVRAAAIDALAGNHQEVWVALLRERLDRGAPIEQVGAAAALGRIPTPSARAALLATAQAPNRVVRAAVVRALGGHADSETLTVLRAASNDKDPAVRQASAESLARAKGSARAQEQLKKLSTADVSVSVRNTATDLLRSKY